MRIGVIGAGSVGGTLGRRWAQLGHSVMFGVRDPQAPKVTDLLSQAGSEASAGTIAEAALFGDVVALATPWDAARQALEAFRELRCYARLGHYRLLSGPAPACSSTRGAFRFFSPRLGCAGAREAPAW